MSYKQKILKWFSGFTMVELVISVAIMTLLASVVLFNYGTFNDNLALSSAGQEMAIAIRQAQIHALNVKESSAGASQYTYAYGIYFNPTDSTTNKNYYIFIDKNADRKFTVDTTCTAVGTECVEKFSIRNGVYISSVDPTSACANEQTLNVIFLRPRPDASINLVNNLGASVCAGAVVGEIELTSAKGKKITVKVQNTGQIYVQ